MTDYHEEPGEYSTPTGTGGMHYSPHPLPPREFTPSDSLQACVEDCVQTLEERAETQPTESALDDAFWAEARASCKIEGIPKPYSTVSLDPETGRIDVPAVTGAYKGVQYAHKHVGGVGGPELLHDLHGQVITTEIPESTIGEYREIQVRIGGGDDAFFPPHPQDIQELMDEFFAYYQSESDLHWVLDAVLMHYQFETIHPYRDGNGRVGRALLSAQLADGLDVDACLLPSVGLAANREAYFDAFTRVRETCDWEHWCETLLNAIAAVDAGDVLE